MGRKIKLAVVCRGTQYFLDPIIEYWKKTNKYEFVHNLEDAHIVWVEWANEQCISASIESPRKNVIVRVLGSEYYQNFWERCGDKIHTFIIENPDYELPFDTIYIPEPINEKFWIPIKNINKQDRTILMVGSYDYYKNQLGLLRILASYPNAFRKIYMIGSMFPKDVDKNIIARRIIKQLDFFAKKHKINLVMLDYMGLEKIREMYNKVDFTISTSINEGCHTAIQEAMMCNCKVLVQDWMGAEKIFPENCLFTTERDFWEKIKNYYSTKSFAPNMREYALKNFSYRKLMPKFDRLIKQIYEENKKIYLS